eukprot:TRINITY_DN8666_c0_g1_i1.p1 TRINITY_DN8666_c0_g1~~TRINITY_DN8666_c0_g1_i1.p1  ORF type:complete len:107 (+),score=6.42 TRINITY_DN8666_c0_g1_i1:18-338(+)
MLQRIGGLSYSPGLFGYRVKQKIKSTKSSVWVRILLYSHEPLFSLARSLGDDDLIEALSTTDSPLLDLIEALSTTDSPLLGILFAVTICSTFCLLEILALANHVSS